MYSLLNIFFLIGLFSLSFYVIFKTGKGLLFLRFFKEARYEMRKVFWPSRQETIQTATVVVFVVIVVSLFLWVLDSLLSWAVSSFF